MTAVTPEISEAEAKRRDTAAKRMNRPAAKVKNVRTRLTNLLEDMDQDSPEFHALQEEFAEILRLKQGSPDVVSVDSDDEALRILRAPHVETRDYDALIASLDAEIREQLRLYNQAASSEVRAHHSRRVDSLKRLLPVVEAAKTIPPGTRTFGCRKYPRLKISGRESVFPDVQFTFHTVTTDDPLVIARLLDYMANPLPGDPLIEVRRNGDVALVNDRNGEFGQWVHVDEAEDVIRTMNGSVRRPFR